MRNACLQIISSKPLLPSVGPSFLEGMGLCLLRSDIFLHKTQVGSGAEMNDELGQAGESRRTGHLRVKHM